MQPPTTRRPRKSGSADRTWSLPALIAVALAAVILGGLGGAAVARPPVDDDERRRTGQGRFQRGGTQWPTRHALAADGSG